MTDVVLNEKLKDKSNAVEHYYRYGSYFYLYGIVLLKLNRPAKECLKKAEVMWKDVLSQKDPTLKALYQLIKICNK
jgi:hypothetical protein